MTRLGAFPQILILRYVLIPCLYGPQFNVKLEEEVVKSWSPLQFLFN